MSIRAMNAAWQAKLPPAQKFVMIAMADYASDDGANIFPSVGTLAEKTGHSERQVRRILRTLEEQGFIWRTGWHLIGGRGDRATIEYAMKIPAEREDNMTPRAAAGGQNGYVRGDTLNTNGGTPMSADPLERDPLERDPKIQINQIVADGAGAPKKKEPDVSPDELVEGWNDLAKDMGLTAVKSFTASRRQKAVARLNEHPEQKFWDEVFYELSSSPFLLGRRKRKEGDSNWRVSFDWLIANDTNAVKVAEGRY